MLIGFISKLSTRYCNTLDDINAGSDGPIWIPLTPSERRAKRSATAFCSYHDKIIDNGSEFTSVLNASAKDKAIFTAE